MALQFNEGAYGQVYSLGQQNEQANRERQDRLLQLISQGIGGGLESYQKSKLAETKAAQDKKLYELQLNKAQNELKETEAENTPIGTLLSQDMTSMPVTSFDMIQKPLESVYTPPPQVPQSNLSPRPNIMEQFRNFQGGNRLRPNRMDIGSEAQIQGPLERPIPGTPYNVEGPQPEPDISGRMAALGLPMEARYLTPKQLKLAGEAKKLFASAGESDYKQPTSIDQILANRVNKGEMSLEEAIKLKQQGQSFIMGGVNAEGSPIFYGTKDPKQTVTGHVPGGGILYPKTPSLDQSNAGIYGQRSAEANQQLETLLTEGFDPTSLASGSSSYLPNIVQPSNVQAYEQLKRNFINATLRRESGATIRDEEMENANKQYFPQAGDSAEVLKQKKLNRQTVIQGLGKIAGPMGSQSIQPQQQNQDPLGLGL